MSNFNFLEAMQQEQETMSSGERDEIPTPKNTPIYIDKRNTPELTLRILPSLAMAKQEAGAQLGVKQRTIFFNLKMTSKIQTTNLVLPQTVDNTNETEQKVNKWTSDGFANRMMTDHGPAAPSNTYWLNALVLERDNTGEYVPKKNDQGVPQVFAFRIGWSGYSKILKQASNVDFAIKNDQGVLDSFISFGKSYPVQIGKSSPTEFSVQVLANRTLPNIEDLPGVAKQLDDFENIIKPTDVTQPNWFQSVVYFMEEMGNPNGEAAQQQATASGLDYTKPAFSTAQPVAGESFPDPFAGVNIDESAIPNKATAQTPPAAQTTPPAQVTQSTPVAQTPPVAKAEPATQTEIQTPSEAASIDDMLANILGN